MNSSEKLTNKSSGAKKWAKAWSHSTKGGICQICATRALAPGPSSRWENMTRDRLAALSPAPFSLPAPSHPNGKHPSCVKDQITLFFSLMMGCIARCSECMQVTSGIKLL